MALLRAGLSPDPAARPQSAAALRDALDRPAPATPAAAVRADMHSRGSAPAPGRPAPASGRISARAGRPRAAGRPPRRGTARERGTDRGGASPACRAGGRAGRDHRRAVLVGARLLAARAAAPPAGARRDRDRHRARRAAERRRRCVRDPDQQRRLPGGGRPGGGGAVPGEAGVLQRAGRGSAGSATAAPWPVTGRTTGKPSRSPSCPPSVRTFDQRVVAANPTVSTVCSQAVMLASRQGQARRLPARDWRIDVLPPSEAAFGRGSRVYRCLANETGHQPRMSQFRR